MRAGLFALLLMVPSLADGLGMTEDPQEKLTKTYSLEAVKSLEIRGEIQFELVPGPKPQVTVETSRALFDQLNVSNWFGSATVAIESGLRGPREQGSVQVVIELPSLAELTVLDRSSGRVTWPGSVGAQIRVGENSTVAVTFEGTMLGAEVSWLSSLQLKGKTEFLVGEARHQARIDAAGLVAQSVRLALDEESSFRAGTTTKGTGTARHGSRVTVPSVEEWTGLELRESARLEASP